MCAALPNWVDGVSVGSAQGLAALERQLVTLSHCPHTPSPASWPMGWSKTLIPDLATARALFDPGGATARQARAAVYWERGSLRARSRLRIGMHDRAEAHMVAECDIPASDLPSHARNFPLRLQCLRLDRLEVPAHETWDLSPSAQHWPDAHLRDELYTLVLIEELQLNAASCLALNGCVAMLRFGRIVVNASAATPARFRIGATAHPGFSTLKRQTRLHGADGPAGRDGTAAQAAVQDASAFGPCTVYPAQPPTDGQAGSGGDNGAAGPNGGLQMLADIRICRGLLGAAASLQLEGQAGAGSPGGNGGNGGNGGAAGSCVDAPFPPARAGAGGNGGAGGPGGSGGLSSNIFVSVPRQHLQTLQLRSLLAPGGRGGLSGSPGTGTPDGQPGANGLPGRERDGPPIWVFAEGEPTLNPIAHNFSSASQPKEQP